MPPDTRPRPLATLVRLAWRYRSELAPLWLALALFAAGVVLRLALLGRPTFPVLVSLNLATITTAAALWTYGPRLGLDRQAERAYAAVVALAGGLWLALAVTVGPLTWPLPLAWLLGSLAAAVPWWAHHRRRAKVRVVRTVKRWATHADHAGLSGSNLQRVEVDPAGGWTARLMLRPGQTLDDVLARVRALESALGLRPRAIEADEDPRLARRVILRVQPRDPHAAALAWPGPPGDASITRPVVIGRYQDATPTATPLAGQHALIAGATGSGKSGVVNAIIGYLAACPDVVLWGCDLKFGLELGPWRPVFAPGRVATTPEQAAGLLAAAVQVIQARGEELARQGLREWPISPQCPALVVVIDEHAKLAAQPAAIAAIETITAQGRALAVGVIDATQYPTVAALGSSLIAPQMTVKVCLRVNSPTEVNVILGPGAASAGWAAHKIPKGKAGTLYLDAPGADTPRLARAFHVTDPMVERTARRYANHRPALDAFSEHAANTHSDQPALAAPGPTHPQTTRLPAPDPTEAPTTALPEADPLEALLEALRAAGPHGAKVAELAQVTGRQKTWVYERLQDLARDGHVTRAGHGRWRLTITEAPDDDHPA
ncbi:MAG TPA: FtsK/SpoIIIE domain-containing protein [Actinomycetes bacterium]|jgi:S-DNA-T family DNA segregation ATPase FtsK/SpoIIIE|nr:FtsK/SpoIIIE domain-containing protein [Actinomycetes bacterium]